MTTLKEAVQKADPNKVDTAHEAVISFLDEVDGKKPAAGTAAQPVQQSSQQQPPAAIGSSAQPIREGGQPATTQAQSIQQGSQQQPPAAIGSSAQPIREGGQPATTQAQPIQQGGQQQQLQLPSAAPATDARNSKISTAGNAQVSPTQQSGQKEQQQAPAGIGSQPGVTQAQPVQQSGQQQLQLPPAAAKTDARNSQLSTAGNAQVTSQQNGQQQQQQAHAGTGSRPEDMQVQPIQQSGQQQQLQVPPATATSDARGSQISTAGNTQVTSQKSGQQQLQVPSAAAATGVQDSSRQSNAGNAQVQPVQQSSQQQSQQSPTESTAQPSQQVGQQQLQVPSVAATDARNNINQSASEHVEAQSIQQQQVLAEDSNAVGDGAPTSAENTVVPEDGAANASPPAPTVGDISPNSLDIFTDGGDDVDRSGVSPGSSHFYYGEGGPSEETPLAMRVVLQQVQDLKNELETLQKKHAVLLEDHEALRKRVGESGPATGTETARSSQKSVAEPMGKTATEQSMGRTATGQSVGEDGLEDDVEATPEMIPIVSVASTTQHRGTVYRLDLDYGEDIESDGSEDWDEMRARILGRKHTLPVSRVQQLEMDSEGRKPHMIVGGGGKQGSPSPANWKTASTREDIDLFKMAEPILNPTRFTVKQRKRAVERVKFCLERRGVSAHRWYGPGTPLAGSLQARSKEFAEAVLNAHADPNKLDEKGVTVLHYTAFDGQADLCQLLCEKKADPNSKDGWGQTPLFFAQKPTVCEVLVKFRGDISMVNVRGQSAVHLAAQAAFADVLLWYSTHASRALLRMRDGEGLTAADHAADSGVRFEVLSKFGEATGVGASVYSKPDIVAQSAAAAPPHAGLAVPGIASSRGGSRQSSIAVPGEEPGTVSPDQRKRRESQETEATRIQSVWRASQARRENPNYREELPDQLRMSQEEREREMQALQRHMQGLNVGAKTPQSKAGSQSKRRASSAVGKTKSKV